MAVLLVRAVFNAGLISDHPNGGQSLDPECATVDDRNLYALVASTLRRIWLVVGDALNAIGADVVEVVGHVLSAHAHDTSA